MPLSYDPGGLTETPLFWLELTNPALAEDPKARHPQPLLKAWGLPRSALRLTSPGPHGACLGLLSA